MLCLTPAGSARMRSNLIVLRGEDDQLCFVDCGTPRDPGNGLLRRALQKRDIARDGVAYLVITHHHNDHVANLSGFRRLFPRLRVYVNAVETALVRNPYRHSADWNNLYPALGVGSAYRFLSRALMPFVGRLLFRDHAVLNQVDYEFPPVQRQLPLPGFDLEVVPTPGHSPGHTTYWDRARDVLFLGDLVPGTPWLHPGHGSLARMIASIERLLALPQDRVAYSVRSHCNASDHGRFVYPWPEERARFETFLALIHHTLDRIPALLRGRALTAMQVAEATITKFKQYNNLMSKFWVPPGLTWVVGYLDHLATAGAVQRVARPGPLVYWTS